MHVRPLMSGGDEDGRGGGTEDWAQCLFAEPTEEFREFDGDAELARVRSDAARLELEAREAMAARRSSLVPEASPAHWSELRAPSAPADLAASAGDEIAPLEETPTELPEPVEVEEDAVVFVGSADARFETSEDPRIPAGRLRFGCDEVARLVGLDPEALRSWKAEPTVGGTDVLRGGASFCREEFATLLRCRRLRDHAPLTVARTGAALMGSACDAIPVDVEFLVSELPTDESSLAELRDRLALLREEAAALAELSEQGAREG